MDNNNHAMGALLHNMNVVTPNPGPDAVSITGVVRKSGKIAGYQLSNGELVDKSQGVRMAKQGHIRGVAVATNQGNEYLRALPDGDESNNLRNLPSIMA